MSDPVFTADWFSQNIGPLTEVLAKFKGIPSIKMLEIGCFEGRGTLWFLENILTGPGSTIDCVDTFEGSQEHRHFGFGFDLVREKFVNNIQTSSRVYDVRLESRPSYNYLKCCNIIHDIIYVDGSHMAPDVLSDLVLSWPLLKQGGVLFADDYLWPGTDALEIHRPKPAIDAFLYVFAEQLKVLHMGYSVAVEKL